MIVHTAHAIVTIVRAIAHTVHVTVTIAHVIVPMIVLAKAIIKI